MFSFSLQLALPAPKSACTLCYVSGCCFGGHAHTLFPGVETILGEGTGMGDEISSIEGDLVMVCKVRLILST